MQISVGFDEGGLGEDDGEEPVPVLLLPPGETGGVGPGAELGALGRTVHSLCVE
jgi:hypothetical protein